ncbi:tannase/feruloyl esterase family alpha/beta hydrolase, partial [bacterium]|nr:tannase/feruloyl esterase family alpha/beta hydrolase [bacterium]
FAGCSTGGRLAAKAALKYPTEFNGIVSGAPALDYPGLVGTAFDWLVRTNTDRRGRQVFNADNTAKAALIYNATVAQCDKLDGVADGSIADPRRCAPDLRPLSCGIADGPVCLTAEEQRVAELWRRGPRDSLGRQLYPGGVPEGSELYWGLWLTGSPPFKATLPKGFAQPIAEQFLRYLAFSPDAGPNYQLTDFDFDRDPARMSVAAEALNADDPDLTKFQQAGGKMVMYHGWADPLVTPYKTVEYFEAVRGAMGGAENVDKFLRLFMIPGMDHCGVQSAYGPGVDERSVDPLTALEDWVEKDAAPATLPTTAYAKDGSTAWSRPICRFPQRTTLKDGAADWREPTNWTCK